MQEVHCANLYQEHDEVEELGVQDVSWLVDLALDGDVDRRQNSKPFLPESFANASFA